MSKKRIAIFASIGIIALLITSIMIFTSRQSAESPDRLISLGEKYLTELNYEQALVQFLKVIEIDPMNPRGYTGAAEAYVGLGRMDDAVAILQQGLERTEDEDIRAILDELTKTLPDDPVDVSGDHSGILDVKSSILTSEQLSFLEPLEAALLAFDYETALRIQDSAEFAEIYKAIPGWEEGVYRISEEVVYKTDGEHEWYIQNNTVGPNGTNYGPRVGVWINGRENGTHIHSFFPLQSTPIHVLITSTKYSSGIANGSYKRVYYEEGGSYTIESGTALNGLKHGEEIIETDFLIASPYSPIHHASGNELYWVCIFDNGLFTIFTGSEDMYNLQETLYEDGSVGHAVCVDLETRGELGAGYMSERFMNEIQEIY